MDPDTAMELNPANVDLVGQIYASLEVLSSGPGNTTRGPCFIPVVSLLHYAGTGNAELTGVWLVEDVVNL
jgi:hypothetical protein